MDRDTFWHIRAAKYDRLFWTKDKAYLSAILRLSKFRKSDLVLDVGTGTGIMARAIRPYVRHVVGLDISETMLKKGNWEGVSLIKWDIAETIFVNSLFDKLIARMVFHHILDNLDRVFLRCYDLLKNKGTLIVAEGVPPADDHEVVSWYTNMFKLKENRRIFKSCDLVYHFQKNGFKQVKVFTHITHNFSIKNWIINSGLEVKLQKEILKMHINAPRGVKHAYNMRIVKGDCLIDAKNLIVIGQKKNVC